MGIKVINGRTQSARVRAAEALDEKTTSHWDRWNLQDWIKRTDGLPVVIFGDTGGYHSLAQIVKNLAEALDTLGIQVIVRSHEMSNGYDSEKLRSLRKFLGHEPKAFIGIWVMGDDFDHPGAKVKIQIDSIDTFRVYEKEWLEKYEELDLILTYSTHSAKEMVKCGIPKKKVRIMPLGVNRTLWRRRSYNPLPLDKLNVVAANRRVGVLSDYLQNRKVFFVCGMMQHRKGIPALLKAYDKAMGTEDEAVLWIHGSSEAWGNHKDVALIQSGPPKIWTDGVLTDLELANILSHHVHAYVHASHLEGFGLMPLQAMACSCPVIALDYSGPADYLTGSNADLVQSRETTAKALKIKGVPPKVKMGTYESNDLCHEIQDSMWKPGDTGKVENGLETAKAWGWDRTAASVVEAIEGLKDAPQIACAAPYRQNHLDILFPCREGQEDAVRMLDSLAENPPRLPFSVTIVDDGSTKRLPKKEWKEQYDFEIRVLRNETAKGVPFSRNRLWAETDGEWTFVCDTDLEFLEPNWDKPLVTEILLHQDVAIAAPLLIYPSGKVQSAGGTHNGEGLPIKHRFHGQDQYVNDVLEPVDLSYAPAAAWMIHRTTVNKVGPMFEAFFPTSFDDVDWCYMARHLRMRIRYIPETVICHHEGSFRSKSGDFGFQANLKRWAAIWRPWEDWTLKPCL